MDSRDITLWLDSRWCAALESATGKTMDTLMREQMDALIQTLPQDVRDRITDEIRQEDKQRAEAQERSRRFSVTRVTEFKETRICLIERGETPFQVAQRLRRYLRGENGGQGLCSDGAPLTEAEMERYVAEAVSGSPRVVGVYDINLDAGEFSMLDAKDGWETHRVREVSTAVYYAAKKESTDWITKRDSFRERLDRLELLCPQRPVFIRGAQPLPVDKISFEDEASQIGNRLEFFAPVDFDSGAVFGISAKKDEEWVNLYANYDMDRGCVCDTLEVYLMREDGYTQYQYHLSQEECAALFTKMDADCKEQMGLSLEEAKAQYLSDGLGEAAPAEVTQIPPQQSGPMMQM